MSIVRLKNANSTFLSLHLGLAPRVPPYGQKRSLGQSPPLGWKEGKEVEILPFASGEAGARTF